MMNREASIHSSDTLVVVDRSRQRRRLMIAGAALLVLVVIGLAMMLGRGAGKEAAPTTAGGAGQIPTVTVTVPGKSQVGRVVTASGPLAAKRDQPVGIAG